MHLFKAVLLDCLNQPYPHFRWNCDNLPGVKYDDIEEMIAHVLDDSGMRVENRTVDRTSLEGEPSNPPQSWNIDRVNKVRFWVD